MTDQHRIAILGFGKVGTALAFALASQGETICAVTARGNESISRVRRMFGASRIVQDPLRAAAKGSTVLLAVADTELAPLAAALARAPWLWDGKIVLGFSGLLGAAPLASLSERGASCGSMHPLKSFSRIEEDADGFLDVTFGLQGDGPARAESKRLAECLGASWIELSEHSLPLYHAAAAMAANHGVALVALAQQMMEAALPDLPPGRALNALMPLVTGALKSAFELGPVNALTGPLVRGDAAAIAAHLEAVAGQFPQALEPYKALAAWGLGLARARGEAGSASLAAIEGLLAKELP